MNKSKRNIWYRLLSIPITVLLALFIYFLKIPNPMMILIIPVVYFSYAEGFISGTCSGLCSIAYSVFFFVFQTKDEKALAKTITIVLAVSVIIFLVGSLKRRESNHYSEAEKLSDNFLNVLSGMNVQLLVTELKTDEILFANKKMNTSYNVTKDPTGKYCWEVYHGLDSRCVFCVKGQLYDNPNEPIEWEYYNERAQKWFHNTESLIRWTDGRMVHLQQAVDITQSKKSQEELKLAKEVAEDSAKAKANFLANMSHEIRTPMNAIIGMTELAKSSDDKERILYCLAKVNDAAEHLLGVINDILDISKIDAGKLELSSVDFPIEKMLQRVSAVTLFRAEQKQQDFIIKVDKGVPQAIVSDQQRLTQVITNLLSNAVKFTPEEGMIRLFIRKVDERDGKCTLEFNVTDTGIGISKEAQTKLFKSFNQADNSISRRFGGTGLGLAISKSIVDKMGGSFSVESEEGKGARFYFQIEIPIGKSALETKLGSGVDWKKVNILVVDDSHDVLEYFKDITSTVGLNCKTADNAIDALQILDGGAPYQLVFVDWRMPKVDGVELTRRIRERYNENIVVIMISAAEWTEIESEARTAGVDDFISKPLLPSIIIDSLNKSLATNADLYREPGEEKNYGIFQGKNILLAEDIEINREILMAMLEDTGVKIYCAENGREAVDMYLEDPQKYDLILMDIQMPEMDGYEATHLIRDSDAVNASQIPIVAMTANVFKEDIERCVQAGMNDHIGKPIDTDEMIKKLRINLKR